MVLLPFLNPTWTSGKSRFMYCWSLAWRIFSISLLVCEMSAIVQWIEHSLALLFFGIGMKTPFPVLWPLLCFPNFLAYWTFTASSFRIWNSPTGILSPPLALFIVMLLKAHLTSHSKMSGFRWVITPSWLSGSWRSFLYSSSVYFCHLFLISYASVMSIPFLLGQYHFH